MKKKAPTTFYGKAGVSGYLGISRMTLSRWERVLPLPSDGSRWIRYDKRYTSEELKEWKGKVFDKLRHVRPRGVYNRWKVLGD